MAEPIDHLAARSGYLHELKAELTPEQLEEQRAFYRAEMERTDDDGRGMYRSAAFRRWKCGKPPQRCPERSLGILKRPPESPSTVWGYRGVLQDPPNDVPTSGRRRSGDPGAFYWSASQRWRSRDAVALLIPAALATSETGTPGPSGFSTARRVLLSPSLAQRSG